MRTPFRRRKVKTDQALTVLLASATVEVDEEVGDAMAEALSAALAPSRSPIRLGAGSLMLTIPAGSRHETLRQARAVAVAMAQLTASIGTHICVAGAWCSPTDTPLVVAGRARTALSVALARASTDPVVWDARRHGWLASRPDDSWPAVDPPLGRIRPWWASLAKTNSRLANIALVVTSYALALILPFLFYATVWLVLGRNPVDVAFYVVFSLLMLTTGVLFGEALLAIEPGRTPPEPERWPSATAVIPAWLPNERDHLTDSLRRFLEIDYPGGLQVVCAYNTDRSFPEAEAELNRLAAAEPRLTVSRVQGSKSKAQNLNAALTIIDTEMVGVFDADHRPDPDAFERAGRWLADGWDCVQGRCTVRLPEDPPLIQRLVATEFETIYGVSHPGRARRDCFAIFGGSNGYWRTATLKALRFAPDRLTEDIDLSLRALLAGARIGTDRSIVSSELPPSDIGSFWGQRGRWAQGWSQVSRRWLLPILCTRNLRFRQKLGGGLLLGLREVTPWAALQIYPILAFHALFGVGHKVSWFLPIFVLSTVLSLGVAAWQATVAWSWADPRCRSRGEYVSYFLHNLVWFSEFKMLISRVAHLRAALGETQWKVTRRATQGAPATTEPADDPLTRTLTAA